MKNFTSNITINRTNGTIIITKSFENKASKYGSEEYKTLLQAQQENAGFKVVVKSSTRKSSKASKITLEDMKRYIEFHDDSNKSGMTAFEKMYNAKKYGELQNKTFFEIKKWFFEQYPEVA